MYSETITILITLREDIVENLINIALDFEIEKIKIIHILDDYFESQDYDITKISTSGFKKFINDNLESIRKEKYYQECYSDIISRLAEHDYKQLDKTGIKTENHMELEIDMYLYDGIVRRYGIGEILIKEQR